MIVLTKVKELMAGNKIRHLRLVRPGLPEFVFQHKECEQEYRSALLFQM